MAIQWFPGHMHKARVQMEQAVGQVDMFIELLDSRIPYSSDNPMLAEIRKQKPCLKVLSKSDLADPERTKIWQTHLERETGVKARAITTEQPGQIKRLTQVCCQLVPDNPDIAAMIVGIPNVGKSTLINALAGRKVAKTGNEPAVTKGQQKIRIGDGVMLLDTPGVLWPKVENPKSGYRLALTGAIKDTAMDYDDVALFAAEFVLEHYPQRHVECYSLEDAPDSAVGIIESVGKRRGFLYKGGVVDFERSARTFLHDLRAGKLGPMTFETPEMIAQEEVEVEELRQKKAEKKQQRKERYKSRRKR